MILPWSWIVLDSTFSKFSIPGHIMCPCKNRNHTLAMTWICTWMRNYGWLPKELHNLGSSRGSSPDKETTNHDFGAGREVRFRLWRVGDVERCIPECYIRWSYSVRLIQMMKYLNVMVTWKMPTKKCILIVSLRNYRWLYVCFTLNTLTKLLLRRFKCFLNFCES